jgi:hypothetical protein
VRSQSRGIDATPLGRGMHVAASACVELGVVEEAGLLQHDSLLDDKEQQVVLCGDSEHAVNASIERKWPQARRRSGQSEGAERRNAYPPSSSRSSSFFTMRWPMEGARRQEVVERGGDGGHKVRSHKLGRRWAQVWRRYTGVGAVVRRRGDRVEEGEGRWASVVESNDRERT